MRQGRARALAGGLLALSAVALLAACSTPAAPAGPVDVVLISVDTLRADRLGCYGNAAVSTPVLDDLAARGARFAHAVAPAPLTLPSHASLLTATSPLRHGVHDNIGFALPAAIPTIAEQFRAAGYATAAFVSGAPLQQRFGLGRGFDRYDDRFTSSGGAAPANAVERRADQTVAAADRWLRETGGAPHPIFMWVHFFDPHAPYEPPEPYAARFSQRPYDGEIAFVDAQIGALMDRVRGARGGRRLLVAVAADHGEGLGDHGEETHGLFIYDSTIHVPLILQGSGVPAGRVVPELTSLVDVAPTLLDLAAVPLMRGVDGTSLRGALTARVAERPVYAESLFGWMCCGWAPLRGWRDGSLMLIDAPRPELYDTGADAAQTRNVAADRPAEFARLKGALTEAMRHQSASARADTSPSTTAQLASLGYVAPGSVAKPSLRDPKDMAAISARIGRAIDIEDSNPAAAARELAAAVQQDPQNPLARRHLGASLLRAGRLQEASAVLHALASDGDDSTDTLTQLADLAFEQRDFRQARARLETIYGRDPQDATALKLGIACAKSGDIDRAIALFEIVVSRDPANVDARVDLAGALLQRGRAAEAARQFQGAIDAGAAAPLVWNGLASAKMQSGDRRGAADALRESLRLEPNQADIARTLAGLDR